MYHGRVRCAIQIAPIPPEEHNNWCHEKWGWQEKKKGIWEPYKVVKRKFLFETCYLTQSVQGGKPWKLYEDEQYLTETAKVLLALSGGTEVTSSQMAYNGSNR